MPVGGVWQSAGVGILRPRGEHVVHGLPFVLFDGRKRQCRAFTTRAGWGDTCQRGGAGRGGVVQAGGGGGVGCAVSATRWGVGWGGMWVKGVGGATGVRPGGVIWATGVGVGCRPEREQALWVCQPLWGRTGQVSLSGPSRQVHVRPWWERCLSHWLAEAGWQQKLELGCLSVTSVWGLTETLLDGTQVHRLWELSQAGLDLGFCPGWVQFWQEACRQFGENTPTLDTWWNSSSLPPPRWDLSTLADLRKNPAKSVWQEAPYPRFLLLVTFCPPTSAPVLGHNPHLSRLHLEWSHVLHSGLSSPIPIPSG